MKTGETRSDLTDQKQPLSCSKLLPFITEDWSRLQRGESSRLAKKKAQAYSCHRARLRRYIRAKMDVKVAPADSSAGRRLRHEDERQSCLELHCTTCAAKRHETMEDMFNECSLFICRCFDINKGFDVLQVILSSSEKLRTAVSSAMLIPQSAKSFKKHLNLGKTPN